MEQSLALVILIVTISVRRLVTVMAIYDLYCYLGAEFLFVFECRCRHY